MIITTYTRAGYSTPYILQAPKLKSRIIIQEEGMGMPPIEYVTQRGPFQHGESYIDYFLKPRVIQIVIRHKYCSEAAYHAGRAELLNQLRPNNAPPDTQGILRRTYPDGSVRCIKVMIQEGPNFAPHRSGWDEWAYDETLRFIAHDPIWYNPYVNILTLPYADSGGTLAFDELVFPFTGPFSFSTTVYVPPGGGGTANALTNNGSWMTYPSIEIDGPISYPTIYNSTTDERLTLLTTIPAGEYIVFELSYGEKRVFDIYGTNRMQDVSSDSDLATFHLNPGINYIYAGGTSVGIGSAFILRWYDRYIGV